MPNVHEFADWGRQDLEEAKDLLVDVKAELARGRRRARVSPHPRDTDDMEPYLGYHEERAEYRRGVADDLKAMGKFSGVERERGGDALLIEADLATVKAALHEAETVLTPPALPVTPPVVERQKSALRLRFEETLGTGLAYAVIIGGTLILSALATWLIPGFGELLIRLIGALSDIKGSP